MISPLKGLLSALGSTLGGIGAWLTSTLFSNLSQWFGHLAGLLAGWLASKGKKALDWLKNLWPGLAAAFPYISWGALGAAVGLGAAWAYKKYEREVKTGIYDATRWLYEKTGGIVNLPLAQDIALERAAEGPGGIWVDPELKRLLRKGVTIPDEVYFAPVAPSVQQDISVNVQVSVQPGTDGDTAQRTAEETARAVEETMRRILAEQRFQGFLEDYTRPKFR